MGVETKMKQYEDEIATKFDRLGDMQTSGTDQIKRLAARKQQLESSVSVLKQQVGVLKLKHDSRKQQLLDDEVASSLGGQEEKIKQFGQTLNHLNSFIKQRNSETDYQGEMATCLDISGILNKFLLERRIPGP